MLEIALSEPAYWKCFHLLLSDLELLGEQDFIAGYLHRKAYYTFVFDNGTSLHTEHQSSKEILHKLLLQQTLQSLDIAKDIGRVKGFAHIVKTEPYISTTNSCLLVK